ncbi:hypothetical protein RRG08_035171 [Elysia crispata]|uniref:Uncharacterized protein n=1 Tax=Elysia crispata TaxID=231223 RepID=A0AAE1AYF7_9GAST|nr:hypothetical protein RRG08_035171 [Elysia crispata]
MQVKLSEVWAFLAMILMIGLPLINEAWDIWSTLMLRNKVSDGDEEFIISQAPQGKQSIQSQHGKRSTSVSSIVPPRSLKQKSSTDEQNAAMIHTITGNVKESEAQQVIISSENGTTADLKKATAKGLFQRPMQQNNSHQPKSLESEVVGVQNNSSPAESEHRHNASAQKESDIPSAGFSTPVKSASMEISTRSAESMNSGKYIRAQTSQSGDKLTNTEYTEVGFSDVITPMVSAITPAKQVQLDMRSEVSDLDEPLF